jgi:hypothetical protein
MRKGCVHAYCVDNRFPSEAHVVGSVSRSGSGPMTGVTIPVLPKLPMVKNAFVIYDPKTEKYSRGGMSPSWSKKPKTWSGWGPLKNHLAMFIQYELLGKETSYLDRKRKYGLTPHQPYTDCLIYDIVWNTYICRVQDVFDEMIADRVEQDKKDQKKRIERLTEKIRQMNEEVE